MEAFVEIPLHSLTNGGLIALRNLLENELQQARKRAAAQPTSAQARGECRFWSFRVDKCTNELSRRVG